ncbi:MAG TPA: thiol-disulfide oxidoreductase DCC family protein [Chitinophagaceae bacterium]|nr:thiol-disulfide oxidoreductase DCC family protein [Chitinophagaceae bacterium]
MKENPVIFFDGVCNYCSRMVGFVIRQDKKQVFKFAALQSEAAQKKLENFQLPQNNFDSFILMENGKVYKSSTAGLRLLNRLPWYWKWTQLFWIVPKFLRDAVYDIVARNRYRIFGKSEQCMVPTPELRDRFLN